MEQDFHTLEEALQSHMESDLAFEQRLQFHFQRDRNYLSLFETETAQLSARLREKTALCEERGRVISNLEGQLSESRKRLGMVEEDGESTETAARILAGMSSGWKAS